MSTPTLVLKPKLFSKIRRPIKLYWWRYDYPHKLNFGDEVTPHIIRALWGRKVKWADVDKCQMIGAGSILDIVERKKPHQTIKVWGSGFIYKGGKTALRNLDIYALRGPLSASRVESQTRPIALGDPGLLVNLVFPRAEKTTYKLGILTHYVDEDNEKLKKYRENAGILFISALQSPEKVAYDITSCEYIVSSSLHGLIFADSYAVPNNWMPLSDKLTGGDYKFQDYYASTNRKIIKKDLRIVDDDNARKLAIKSYVPIHNLREIQRGLIESFPYR